MGESSAAATKKDDLAAAVTEMKISSKKKHGSHHTSNQPEQRFIIQANGTTYECVGRTGKGSFGVVYKAIQAGRDTVAIKRVLQDPRYKNRELQIMKMVEHPNTVKLLDNFYERSKDGEVYLSLVLGYMPKNLYEVCSAFSKRNEKMPIEHVQIYVYQLCRALAYVHSLGICHRDIKPQNLLINPESLELKLCDFGSAKILMQGEPNVSYICSRYYRAPELIFNASDYTTAIDVWSAGCVMAELIMGQPVFAGESGVSQLVEIIKVLGTPTREDIRFMNKDYKDYKQFPAIKPHSWNKLFPGKTPASALALMSKMLIYAPHQRIKPLEACAHLFFNDLRQSNNSKLPLFDFAEHELEYAHKYNLLEQLLPPANYESLPPQFKIQSETATSTPPSSQPAKSEDSESFEILN